MAVAVTLVGQGRTANGSRRTETFLVTRLGGDAQTATITTSTGNRISAVVTKSDATTTATINAANQKQVALASIPAGVLALVVVVQIEKL
jgi:hypothetical protein